MLFDLLEGISNVSDFLFQNWFIVLFQCVVGQIQLLFLKMLKICCQSVQTRSLLFRCWAMRVRDLICEQAG